ncbi:Ribonuclease P subunit [Theobroma cacao]|nr:Ribonuclease P subunit [Theobroma cacao]
MGKRGGGAKRAANTPSKFQKTISLREEASGRKQTKGGSTNVKAILKNEHLQNLAVWASGEASIPSLASFFGHQLAADGEASSIPPDSSFFPCQRCETILQPGFNCTVRIEKNRAKARHRRKKPHILTQNSVVYNCHFCSHRNLKRGTPKGHMKEMYPPKLKASSIPKVVKSRLKKSVTSSGKETNKDELNKVDVISLPTIAAEDPTTDGPMTPLSRGRTLLDGKKRNRNKSGSKRPAESENNLTTLDAGKTVGTSSKRRRKSWMSLCEIVQSSEDNHGNVPNSRIPFLL